MVSRRAPKQPDWYKTAVFYEVLVRAFNDFTNDGTGDLRGLADKLDYLQWLGVDCLWLPPFYASPLRDGGYDISDFRAVLPEFGTVEDFVYLLDQAHRRGLRVITDLVLNHTSDAHPWFQESRQHPDGPYGDYYVWSDTDDRYPDARIIFVDTESSNWTYDPVRGQFYWHRFFSHQPDLNYENPEVQDAMIDVLRFWLEIGIDGFRLDAVPYLYEQEGTNCENLPRTHEFLKRCRKVVDDEYPGRILLAEANQWPADVVQYFGDADSGGDECHMAFHFPLMPRIFMAVRRESRFPISEILAQTPPIPSGAQWGIFLRNHDELTLEMVTDEERDYMYAEYAKDPRMKANIGIRRRLAPLLDNDDNQMELFTAMLLSLPGSPVLYYGDEIGIVTAGRPAITPQGLSQRTGHARRDSRSNKFCGRVMSHFLAIGVQDSVTIWRWDDANDRWTQPQGRWRSSPGDCGSSVITLGSRLFSRWRTRCLCQKRPYRRRTAEINYPVW